MLFPKPQKGSGAAARRARRQKLKKHRDKVKLGVLERDSYICQHEGCGAPSGPPHHIYGRGSNPDHPYEQVDAMLSLCPDCHRKFHHTAEISKEELMADLKRALTR